MSQHVEANSQSQSKDTLMTSKRPMILTIFCFIYLFVYAWLYVSLLNPSYRDSLAKMPLWYVISSTGILNLLGIVSILGIWFMRRWGLYLNLVLTFLSWMLIYFLFHGLPYPGSVLLACVFWAACFVYLKRMRQVKYLYKFHKLRNPNGSLKRTLSS